MEELKIIKTREQYNQYCNELEFLTDQESYDEDRAKLLLLLIKDYDDKHHKIEGLEPLDPVELLKSLMENHELTSNQLAIKLGVDENHINNVLNYQERFSNNFSEKLSSHFKLVKEAFTREYSLKHLEIVYKEIQERFRFLESQPESDEKNFRIRELKLVIVRIQQLFIIDFNTQK